MWWALIDLFNPLEIRKEKKLALFPTSINWSGEETRPYSLAIIDVRARDGHRGLNLCIFYEADKKFKKWNEMERKWNAAATFDRSYV